MLKLNKIVFNCVFLLLTSVSFLAQAHQIRMSVYVEGNELEGEIYYVGGGNPPGAGAKVELQQNKTVIATTTSDDEGLFIFKSVKPDTYKVRADGSQGHVAFVDVDKSEFPDIEDSDGMADPVIETAVSPKESSVVECSSGLTKQDLHATIAKAIRPLREKIDRYEAKTRMHDILGGIGYIFGIFGLLVLLRNRKRP